MEHSITTVAESAGISTRTLRHYGDIGLLRPSRVGANGYRYYNSSALVRLQRILLLRSMGLPLATIRDLIDDDGTDAPAAALRIHLDQLRSEQQRLDRQIHAVLTTVTALKQGEEPMPEQMFQGFDHTDYRDEVEERWGRDAYAEGNSWWRGLSDGQEEFKRSASELQADWIDAASRDAAPSSPEAQALATRHVEWLSGAPGAPRSEDGSLSSEYLRGLADLYVADPRFAANYGGKAGAELVRAALHELLSRSSVRRTNAS